MPTLAAPPRPPRPVRARVLVAVAVALAVLAPAPPLAAGTSDPPAVGWIDAPALALLVDGGDGTGWVDAPGDHDDHDHAPLGGAGSTGTVAAPGPAGAFAAPPNTDFALRFDASVDPATRQVVTAAAGIWSVVLDVRVPIAVDVSMRPMAPGMLGAAGPEGGVHGHPSFPVADLIYPAALANRWPATTSTPRDPTS